MWDRLILACLAVWALLFGLLTVTNITVDFMKSIMGIAALVLGVVCLIRVILNKGHSIS